MRPEEHPFYPGHGRRVDEVAWPLYVIKHASPEELRVILSEQGQELFPLQECVKLAAEARLERLEKEETHDS